MLSGQQGLEFERTELADERRRRVRFCDAAAKYYQRQCRISTLFPIQETDEYLGEHCYEVPVFPKSIDDECFAYETVHPRELIESLGLSPTATIALKCSDPDEYFDSETDSDLDSEVDSKSESELNSDSDSVSPFEFASDSDSDSLLEEEKSGKDSERDWATSSNESNSDEEDVSDIFEVIQRLNERRDKCNAVAAFYGQECRESELFTIEENEVYGPEHHPFKLPPMNPWGPIVLPEPETPEVDDFDDGWETLSSDEELRTASNSQ